MVFQGIITHVAGGGTGSGGTSGIQSINGESGPDITLNASGIIQIAVTSSNTITIGAVNDGSGLNAVNGDTGPNIDLIGVNGIDITTLGSGQILIDGAGASGITKYTANFTGITSGLFTHNFNTFDVVISLYDNQSPREQLFPDTIKLETVNSISVLFNHAQDGRIVIIG